MEHRRPHPIKGTDLPQDYLKMVTEVFTTNFDAGLKALAKVAEGKPYFKVSGQVFVNEVVLCISLMQKGQMAATSVYASVDFDPKASSPTVQDLLSSCVDAAGSVFSYFFAPEHPERIAQVAQSSLAAFEDIPFEWTSVEVDRHKIFLKVDKANPELDQMADDWLRQNDPDIKRIDDETEKETEKLFITGPGAKKKPARGSSSGTLH